MSGPWENGVQRSGRWVESSPPKNTGTHTSIHLHARWRLCSEEMPPPGVLVLTRRMNELGKRETRLCQWFPAHSEEASPESDWFEYSDEDDAHYLPEGWYERCLAYENYTSCGVADSERPTHWMPLPEGP